MTERQLILYRQIQIILCLHIIYKHMPNLYYSGRPTQTVKHVLYMMSSTCVTALLIR